MSRLDFLLWIVLPYAAITVCIAGHIWRYRHDQFTWGTRSTQLLERHNLRPAILMFHLGLLAVFGGHVVGLLVPSSWTEAVGVSEDMYHAGSVAAGTLFGVITVVGFVWLIARRETTPRVRATTTGIDRLTYLLLLIVMSMGMIATLGPNLIGGGYDYRETVSPWFRGVFTLNPDVGLITSAPAVYQLHAICAFLLFALWPFSRLVHVWSIPVSYVGRSYILYRARTRPAPAVARRRADI
ncbi:MAG TPA: respiratory nitrate reductase subunit gamma [Miltoncostaeaceae bacterium]|nr:respiratory nitrate reductase subunit gamma [Miltoncostaeaceae bacterium]